MATRTVYTSTITVPIYAGWKCPKCGEKNFTDGVVTCKRETSSASLRSSKQEEAKAMASQQARNDWLDNALAIMLEPASHPTEVRNGLHLRNTKCTRCGKKPEWDKDTRYIGWCVLALMPAIIAGVVAIAMKTNVVAWLVFLALAGVVGYGFYTEAHYKKIMENLPKRFTPIMGSINVELLQYAQKRGLSIPTPDEVMEIIGADETPIIKKAEPATVSNDTLLRNTSENVEKESEPNPFGFCRKCGAPLFADSGFCHKCGTKIIGE